MAVRGRALKKIIFFYYLIKIFNRNKALMNLYSFYDEVNSCFIPIRGLV